MNLQNIYNFVSELKFNNNKIWFDTNRALYQETKIEFEQIINFLISQISVFDKSISGLDAKDCIFRIHRDVRFAKDKTPYKPYFSAYITENGRKSQFAGYYLHIELDNAFIAGGVYCPQPEALKNIRTAIVENTADFLQIIESKSLKNTFNEVWDDKLKTVPKGFDKNFEHIELIKYKSYIVSKKFDDEAVVTHNFINSVIENCKIIKPFNDFLNTAIKQCK